LFLRPNVMTAQDGFINVVAEEEERFVDFDIE